MNDVCISPDAIARLSERQKQCLRLVFNRKTSKDIAAELGLGVGTVNTYISEAIATLSARNRRHAAEILYISEREFARPDKIELHYVGVPDEPLSSESQDDSSEHWLSLLPLRQSKASGNDLSIFLRIIWPFGIAIFSAIAFGMLAIGTRIVSDGLRAILR